MVYSQSSYFENDPFVTLRSIVNFTIRQSKPFHKSMSGIDVAINMTTTHLVASVHILLQSPWQLIQLLSLDLWCKPLTRAAALWDILEASKTAIIVYFKAQEDNIML